MTLLLCLLLVWAGLASAQDQGFVSVSDATKVKVGLECGSSLMRVRLDFNESAVAEFRDFIIVGLTGDPQCQVVGNGGRSYSLEIPLMADPCGTSMAAEGVFENRIRIAQNKHIVLGGDELVTVRCLYGKPQVADFTLPPTDLSIDATPAISLVGVSPGPRRQPTLRVGGVGGGSGGGGREGLRVELSWIFLLIFVVLFLALLFLLCGCLYFFFKRRKQRVERRKNVVMAVPPGADLGRMGLGQLWWSGKGGSVSNDALLNHDYMLSGQGSSGREGLSVSTDYASSPSASSGSPNTGPGPSQQPNQLYVQDQRLFPRPVPPPGVVFAPSLEETLRSKHNSTLHVHTRSPPPPVYAHVDKASKQSRREAAQPLDSPPMDLRLAGEVGRREREEEAGSVSTLEGGRESRGGGRPAGAATVRADVHAAAVLREAGAASAGAESADRDWTEEWLTAVEELRGPGRAGLTEQEVARWRNLVRNDAGVQEILRRSATAEDLEGLRDSPQRHGLFPPEKWHLIIQSLAHAKFRRRLNAVVEEEVGGRRGGRYVKRGEGQTRPGEGLVRADEAEDAAVARAFQAVEFTRDCGMGETVERVPQVASSGTESSTTPPPPSSTHSSSQAQRPHLAVYRGAPASVSSRPSHSSTAYQRWQAKPNEL